MGSVLTESFDTQQWSVERINDGFPTHEINRFCEC